MHEVHSDGFAKQNAEEMRQRAGPRATETCFRRIGFHPHDEFLKVLRRHLGTNRDREFKFADLRNRHEILVGVVRQVAEDMLMHRSRRDRRDQNGVTVLLGFHDFQNAKPACRAGLVFNHHRPVDRLAQFVGHQPRKCVAISTSGIRKHDPHRLFG